MLPMLCAVSLISPNFGVKSIIFSKFWPRAFSNHFLQILAKGIFPKLLVKALTDQECWCISATDVAGKG